MHLLLLLVLLIKPDLGRAALGGEGKHNWCVPLSDWWPMDLCTASSVAAVIGIATVGARGLVAAASASISAFASADGGGTGVTATAIAAAVRAGPGSTTAICCLHVGCFEISDSWRVTSNLGTCRDRPASRVFMDGRDGKLNLMHLRLKCLLGGVGVLPKPIQCILHDLPELRHGLELQVLVNERRASSLQEFVLGLQPFLFILLGVSGQGPVLCDRIHRRLHAALSGPSTLGHLYAFPHLVCACAEICTSMRGRDAGSGVCASVGRILGRGRCRLPPISILVLLVPGPDQVSGELLENQAFEVHQKVRAAKLNDLHRRRQRRSDL
mmetsp:Transcript_4679/g.11644  ORF Transcript_4679/g.11644 Transcript_4679/m.11644 type:complete len:326 (-) Transcript_4679:212-1189(-)